MNTYILKVYEIRTEQQADWQAESAHELYRDLETANRMLDWYSGDQGHKTYPITESFVECPVIDEVVYVPDYVY